MDILRLVQAIFMHDSEMCTLRNTQVLQMWRAIQPAAVVLHAANKWHSDHMLAVHLRRGDFQRVPSSLGVVLGDGFGVALLYPW